MHITHQESFKAWLVENIRPLCDADPGPLSEYVLALVKKDKKESELKDYCNIQLKVIFSKHTVNFVEQIFRVLKDESYNSNNSSIGDECNDSNNSSNNNNSVNNSSGIVSSAQMPIMSHVVDPMQQQQQLTLPKHFRKRGMAKVRRGRRRCSDSGGKHQKNQQQQPGDSSEEQQLPSRSSLTWTPQTSANDRKLEERKAALERDRKQLQRPEQISMLKDFKNIVATLGNNYSKIKDKEDRHSIAEANKLINAPISNLEKGLGLVSTGSKIVRDLQNEMLDLELEVFEKYGVEPVAEQEKRLAEVRNLLNLHKAILNLEQEVLQKEGFEPVAEQKKRLAELKNRLNLPKEMQDLKLEVFQKEGVEPVAEQKKRQADKSKLRR